ncbi:AraC family transcriptional regulator [Rhodospirillum rubrum]|uniref:AraC family transcriptional regulator n=1 Tax=Rhodospirillum rubrum TaxID=1085 RepID=UPI001906B010|nr:AraC family transcriptional regulator [Rhodospirillum rubrum]MBK1666012.1 AraC family transcriptional regulator [Rhodospirillum rubrum]MBK1678131.1 AraC family transcriptional regulator [Rhodospirillum rubrum]
MRSGKERSSSFRVQRAVIDGVDAVEADTAQAFGRHMHDQFGIGLIERGAQISLSGRGVVEAATGDIITVNPGEVHDGAPIGEGGRSWKMLYFEPALLARTVHDMTEGRRDGCELAHPVIRDAALADRYRALLAAMTAPSGAASAMRAEETLFLMLAPLVEEGRAVDRRRSFPKAIALARARIDDDPAASLTLDDLARLCAISRFQVVRGFARATGLTPHAYMIQRRLQMARRLIARDVGLAEAAASSGFADQSHMTRLFVRAYGLSPGCYAAARR